MEKIDEHFTFFSNLLKRQDPSCSWAQMIRAFDFGEQTEKIVQYLRSTQNLSEEVKEEIMQAVQDLPWKFDQNSVSKFCDLKLKNDRNFASVSFRAFVHAD
jgi:hypothetical protein